MGNEVGWQAFPGDDCPNPGGSGAKYQGRNESLWEKAGETFITWVWQPGDALWKKTLNPNSHLYSSSDCSLRAGLKKWEKAQSGKGIMS